MNDVELEAVVDWGRLSNRSPASGSAAVPIGWQSLWLATQCRPWRSLALVPVGPGVPTVRAARALARASACHLGQEVELIDATSITLGEVRAATEAWIEPRTGTDRVFIALGPVLTSPPSLALALAADAALLCVTLRESSIAEAQRTIEEIGQPRFLGTVCLRRGGEDR